VVLTLAGVGIVARVGPRYVVLYKDVSHIFILIKSSVVWLNKKIIPIDMLRNEFLEVLKTADAMEINDSGRLSIEER